MSASIGSSMFWVAAIVCAIAQAAILRAVIGRAPASTTGFAGLHTTSRSSAAAELVWAIVPAIALALLFVATWRAIHTDRDSPRPATQQVIVPAATAP